MKTNRLIQLGSLAVVIAGFLGMPTASGEQIQTRLRQSSPFASALDRTLTQAAGPLTDSAQNSPDVTGTALANFGYIHLTATVNESGPYYNGGSQGDASFTDTLTITSPTHPNGTSGSLFANLSVTGDIAESVISGQATAAWSLGFGQPGEALFSDDNPSQDHTVSFSAPQFHIADFTFGQPFTLQESLSVLAGTSITGGGYTANVSADVTFQWLGASIVDGSSQPVNDAAYNSASGTDYTMPLSAPEPASWVTLASGIALLCLRRRARLA